MTARRAGLAVAGALLVGSVGCRKDAGSSDDAPVTPPTGGGRASGSSRAGEASRRQSARDAEVARKPETAVLSGVEIRRVDRAGPRPIADRVLSERLGRLLTSSPAFVSAGEQVPAGRNPVPAAIQVIVHDEVLRVPPGAKSRSAHVAVVGIEAQVVWKEGGERLQPRENVLVQKPLDRRDEDRLDQLMPELIASAVDQAGRGLVAKESLRQGDDATVLSAVGSDETDALVWALELCADRRLSAAFDRAVALLDARDPGVQGAALRVLVALRDPRAVAALARRANFADPDMMRTLVETVTAIGGSEAVEFLEMVAGGHADADMRRRAEEGLERLGRRRQRDP